MSETKTKIVPFLREGQIIPGEICDILQHQYTSVFSVPMVNKKVNDPVIFFAGKCDYCVKEMVHIC